MDSRQRYSQTFPQMFHNTTSPVPLQPGEKRSSPKYKDAGQKDLPPSPPCKLVAVGSLMTKNNYLVLTQNKWVIWSFRESEIYLKSLLSDTADGTDHRNFIIKKYSRYIIKDRRWHQMLFVHNQKIFSLLSQWQKYLTIELF